MDKLLKNHVDTKDRILRAAKIEFAEKGFQGARMGSISRRAEANQALIHYYYKSKEKLYIEVLQSTLLIEQFRKIQECIIGLKLTYAQKIYILIYAIINIYLKAISPDSRKIISRAIVDGGDHLHSIVRKYLIPIHEFMEGVIIEGIEAGEFTLVDPLMVIASINYIVISYALLENVLEKTKWYDRLYGEKYVEKLFSFLINTTFKALNPITTLVLLPDVPSSSIKLLDNLIDEVREKENT